MTATVYTVTDSPVGELLLWGQDDALAGLAFHGRDRAPSPGVGWRRTAAPFTAAVQQLQEYFAGHLRTFELKLAPVGTAFQCSVWQALRSIPYGETRSYAQIAAAIGRPTAVRAVGAANGQNPIAIVIPCHRVVGSNGHLTGFGGGLDVKQKLLTLEGSLSRRLLV